MPASIALINPPECSTLGMKDW